MKILAEYNRYGRWNDDTQDSYSSSDSYSYKSKTEASHEKIVEKKLDNINATITWIGWLLVVLLVAKAFKFFIQICYAQEQRNNGHF
jgi:hypothetical protein